MFEHVTYKAVTNSTRHASSEYCIYKSLFIYRFIHCLFIDSFIHCELVPLQLTSIVVKAKRRYSIQLLLYIA